MPVLISDTFETISKSTSVVEDLGDQVTNTSRVSSFLLSHLESASESSV